MAVTLKPVTTFVKFAHEHLKLEGETMQQFAAGFKRLSDKDKHDLARWGCDELGYAGITIASDVKSEAVVS